MIYYEEEINYKPILKTAKELLKKRGYIDCCSILDEGTISVVCTDYDNWNGGTYGYTIYVSLPVSQYGAYTSDRINEFESEISKTFNEVIKADNNSSFITQISPWFSPKDIDSTLIGGEVGKKELLSKIEEISNLLIKVATGGPSFDLVDGDYKKLYNWLSDKLKTLNLDNPNPYFSLWDWYHYYNPNLQRWQDRRVYINELYKPLYVVKQKCTTANIVIYYFWFLGFPSMMMSSFDMLFDVRFTLSCSFPIRRLTFMPKLR